jgi:hypothetical protein
MCCQKKNVLYKKLEISLERVITPLHPDYLCSDKKLKSTYRPKKIEF